MTLLPQRLKGGERGMQSEEAVEIDHRFARNIDAGPHCIVLRFSVRNDDVEPVGGAALEDDHQALVARALDRAKGGARQKARDSGRPYDGKSAVAQEYATGDGHDEPQFSVKPVSSQLSAF